MIKKSFTKNTPPKNSIPIPSYRVGVKRQPPGLMKATIDVQRKENLNGR